MNATGNSRGRGAGPSPFNSTFGLCAHTGVRRGLASWAHRRLGRAHQVSLTLNVILYLGSGRNAASERNKYSYGVTNM